MVKSAVHGWMWSPDGTQGHDGMGDTFQLFKQSLNYKKYNTLCNYCLDSDVLLSPQEGSTVSSCFPTAMKTTTEECKPKSLDKGDWTSNREKSPAAFIQALTITRTWMSESLHRQQKSAPSLPGSGQTHPPHCASMLMVPQQEKHAKLNVKVTKHFHMGVVINRKTVHRYIKCSWPHVKSFFNIWYTKCDLRPLRLSTSLTSELTYNPVS